MKRSGDILLMNVKYKPYKHKNFVSNILTYPKLSQLGLSINNWKVNEYLKSHTYICVRHVKNVKYFSIHKIARVL